MAIVKAIKKPPTTKIGLKKTIEYIAKETGEKGERIYKTNGVNCSDDYKEAFNNFLDTKEYFNKEDGRQCKHYMHSFKGKECSPETAHNIALYLAEKSFPGYEVFVATHVDTKNIHSHFIVNSVNYENGKKLQESPKELEAMKELSNYISLAHGLSIIDEKSKEYNYDLMKSKQVDKKDKISYKLELAFLVERVADETDNKEEFMEKLKENGVETKWGSGRFKNHITFSFPGTENKSIRLKNLHNSYKKEIFTPVALLEKFKDNQIEKVNKIANEEYEERKKSFVNNIKSFISSDPDRLIKEIEKKYSKQFNDIEDKCNLEIEYFKERIEAESKEKSKYEKPKKEEIEDEKIIYKIKMEMQELGLMKNDAEINHEQQEEEAYRKSLDNEFPFGDSSVKESPEIQMRIDEILRAEKEKERKLIEAQNIERNQKNAKEREAARKLIEEQRQKRQEEREARKLIEAQKQKEDNVLDKKDNIIVADKEKEKPKITNNWIRKQKPKDTGHER